MTELALMSDVYQSPSASAGALPRLADVRFPGAVAVISPAVFVGLVRVAESASIAATGYLIAALYVAEPDLSSSWQYFAVPGLTALVAGSGFQMLGLYSVPALTAMGKHLPRLLLGWVAALALLIAAMFFLKTGPDFSRVWLALWFVTGFTALVIGRAVARRTTVRAVAEGRFARRAVIYGSGPNAEKLLTALEADAASDIRICGLFDDRDLVRNGGAVLGYPMLGDTDQMIAFCRNNRVDMVLVALPMSAEARVADLMRHIHILPADIRIAAIASQLKLAPHTYSYVGNVPMLDLSIKPISDWGILAKSLFDKTFAALALLVFSPVMALVALAIRLESKGPVLFKQKRYGFNNELIEVYKFRSMFTDRCDAQASQLVTKNDPRVTRVGRLIRKSSLDELPQFFNVLTGQLSLVGPRPHAMQAKAADTLYPDVVDGYFARHKVKPGITGWAQINGWRGETDTPEKIQKRVEFDLYYIEHWSLWFDIQILAKTPASLLSQRANAY
jgi:Undecaprenyl-phosphate glucose phosphotransferase